MSEVYLKKNEDRRLKAGHQWIFSNEIDRTEGLMESGEVVNLFSSDKRFIGKGLYNKNSLIAYRHLTDKDEDIDKKFFFKKISLANSLRKKKLNCGNVYRMVNSESDFLPGLIIDRYENKFSVQIFSLGMNLFSEMIYEILIENFKAEFIISKNNNELRVLEGLDKQEEVIFELNKNDDKTFMVTLDDIKFKIDLINGQKSGFYLDQNENRLLIRSYVNENSKVLDLFCNEGGFALNAAYAGSEDVTAVDSSDHSVKMAVENAKLNQLSDIKFICKDVFDYVDDLFQTKERFDFIILDPPSFTKSKKNVMSAIRGYQELNYKAMRLLKPNSMLFTFSCSHHINEKSFEEMLVKSSIQAKRKFQILEFRNSSFDHPVLPQMPETKYLKGYLLRVL